MTDKKYNKKVTGNRLQLKLEQSCTPEAEYTEIGGPGVCVCVGVGGGGGGGDGVEGKTWIKRTKNSN